MNNYKWIPLGEVCEFENGDRGKNYPSKNEFQKYGIPFLNAGNIDQNRLCESGFDYITKEKYDSLRSGKAHQGDILFCLRGTIGKCAISSFEVAAIASSLVIIRAKPCIDARYLFYILTSDYFQTCMMNCDNGSVQGNMSVDFLRTIKIPLFSPEKQICIANFLTRFDNKIALNKRMMSELEETARLIYDYWFTQFDFPDENGNPYRSSGGKMTYNKTLNREIPAGWEVVRIGNLFSLQKGYSYSSEELSSVSDNPMISLASIDRKRNYREEELKYLRNDAKTDRVAYPGDLLIACTDLTRNADIVGSPIFVPDEHAKYIFSMDLAKIQTLSSSVTPSYLYEVLRTDWFHNFIKGHTSGTNVIHLDVAGFNWFKVALPPICLQQQYSKLHLRIIEKQNQCRREVAELATLRNWLLPMLMNGQVNTNG